MAVAKQRERRRSAAYRPLLLNILAQEFADADPGEQRELLNRHRAIPCVTDTAAGVSSMELSGEEGDSPSRPSGRRR